VPQSEWLARNASAFAVSAPQPASEDEVVVLPRREISSWLDALPEERDDLWGLVRAMRDRITTEGAHSVQVLFQDGIDSGHLEIHIKRAQPAANTVPPTGLLPSGLLPSGLHLIDAQDGRNLRLELIRCLRDDSLNRIDLLVSFIMKSGMGIIGERLESAIERGAQIRVLTTDYLCVTDADALAQLLDMSEDATPQAGNLDVRLFSDPRTSFHPKAYLFHSSESDHAHGFVGSNNLSRSGIETGVEWSLGTREVQPLVNAFDQLWADKRNQPLSHEFLRIYRTKWRPTAGQVVPVGVETEAPTLKPQIRPIQAEALAALEESRGEGFAAGMVVMATGLGKTWLGAFDSAAFSRTLFVAHREEILRQSRDVFRQVRPDAELGLYMGAEKQPEADVVFASVQTLVRHLNEFDPDEFDYIVVDEFHHAAAGSYRKVIDYFEPRFLLGLTATPERTDGADLLALCSDNLVFECGLIEGIERSELVPFRYWGIKDVADFEGIPWRNGRFEPAQLATRIETQQRAQQAFDEWESLCGERTLGFCSAVTHADFMTQFFTERGVKCAAVHSKPGSSDRRTALADLRSGKLQVVFSVDMFNEGVDVPEVDSVLMLRPTESPVVFLQQLGRGLRLSEGKDHLRVVDFVGNHRSFLLHPRVLLGMGEAGDASNEMILQTLRSGEWDLPAGCSITFDVESIDLLTMLADKKVAGTSLRTSAALEQFCTEYAAEHESRSTAAQAAAAGYNPATAKKQHGAWFGLLDHSDLLEDAETQVWEKYRSVFERLERETFTKSYKLVALKALLSTGNLRTGMSVNALAERSQRIVAGDPRLVADTAGKGMPSPVGATPQTWNKFWRKWPLDHLAKVSAAGGDSDNDRDAAYGDGGGPVGAGVGSRAGALFRYSGDDFVLTFTVAPEDGDVFDAMVAEIVDWRLADYLLRPKAAKSGSVRCRVSHSSGSPILRYDRTRNPELPLGEVPFSANGQEYTGRFVKIALNVATRHEVEGNALPELLRGWFGPDAGHPGTRHSVLLAEGPEGWVMTPDRPSKSA